MLDNDFQNHLEKQILRCRKTLNKKAEHYATNLDRMSNFKQVAGLNMTMPEKAAWDMASKHLASIATMVETPELFKKAQWREKIGDSLNYLFLISAMVEERFE